MGKEADIRQALGDFASRYGPAATMLATVVSVDANAFTCVLDDDGLEYEDVQLRPVLDGNESLTLLPKVGSWVLAIRIENTEDWMVLAAGEFSGFRIKIGTTEFYQDATGFILKKGADTMKQLLTLIIEAIEPVMVMYGNNPNFVKLAQAKTMVNNLLK
jgi:hypothetical protein